MKKMLLLMFVFATSFVTIASAQKDHPAYLHALSDLRASRWLIEHHGGGWKTLEDESKAIRKIDEAINEIKKAAIDDGKNINDHPKVDEVNEHVGRLTKALEFLRKSRSDIEKDEDNDFAKGLRKRAFIHIDEAIRLLEKAKLGIK